MFFGMASLKDPLNEKPKFQGRQSANIREYEEKRLLHQSSSGHSGTHRQHSGCSQIRFYNWEKCKATEEVVKASYELGDIWNSIGVK